jgi:hypothetical protein
MNKDLASKEPLLLLLFFAAAALVGLEPANILGMYRISYYTLYSYRQDSNAFDDMTFYFTSLVKVFTNTVLFPFRETDGRTK